MNDLLCLLSAAFATLCMTASAAQSESTLVRFGPMCLEPTIDGVITREECERTSGNYGLISAETRLMAVRPHAAFVGWTEKGVYCAVRSSLPRSPITLADGDEVVLTLLPPGGNAQRFSVGLSTGRCFPPKGFQAKVRKLDSVAEYGYRCVETEIFVTFDSLKRKPPADGEKWGLQIALGYSSKKETAYWHLADDTGDMGICIFDRAMPVTGLVDFDPLESWRNSANCKLRYRHFNPTKDRMAVESSSVIHHGIGFSKLDADPETTEDVKHRRFSEINAVLEPGEVVEKIPIVYNLWAGTVNILNSEFSWDGKVVYRRTIRWDVGNGLKWESDYPQAHLRCGFYPTAGNRMRIGFTTWGVEGLVHADVRVKGPDGKELWSHDWEGAQSLPGACALPDFSLGDKLAPGVYDVVLTCKAANGRVYTDRRSFTVAKFRWQGLNLGMDRVVIPPYVPLKVEGEKTMALQTGYRCKDLLWDEIYAQDENILAGPVELLLNGKPFTVRKRRVVETADDRVVREVEAAAGKMVLTVRHEYDYDGFCWVTLDFNVVSDVEVDSLQLKVPLKNSLVTLCDVLRRSDKRDLQAPDMFIPAGEGRIWDSSVNTKGRGGYPAAIQPYIFLGGPEKGLCWMAESWQHWSLEEETPAERIERAGDRLTLTCDLINKKTAWTRGPRRFAMGFMPTPAKPQTLEHYREAETMWDYPCPSNAVKFGRGCVAMCSSLNDRMHVYPGNDLSLVRWALAAKDATKEDLAERTKAYMKKHADWFRTCRSTTADDYASGLPSIIRVLNGVHLLYLNPELNTCMWPEYEMYKAEWHCEGWPREDMIHEYLGRPSPSRIDKLLFDGYRALKLGYNGIYYDCFAPSGDRNYLALPRGAFVEPGNVNHLFSPEPALTCLLAWRDLMKRTAVMCHLNGGNLYDQPLVELHTTESHAIPVVSWCSNMLCTERGSNGGDFQDRFPEGYTLAEICGRQSGAVPKIIVSASAGEVERREHEVVSLLGYMCAYGIFGLTDQGVIRGQTDFQKGWNAVFDFGWGRRGVRHHWYYDGKPQPVKHTGRDVRLTVAERKHSALLMFGNLGEEAEVSFTATGLALGKPGRMVDVVTGEELASPRFTIPSHGYKIVRVDAARRK